MDAHQRSYSVDQQQIQLHPDPAHQYQPEVLDHHHHQHHQHHHHQQQQPQYHHQYPMEQPSVIITDHRNVLDKMNTGEGVNSQNYFVEHNNNPYEPLVAHSGISSSSSSSLSASSVSSLISDGAGSPQSVPEINAAAAVAVTTVDKMDLNGTAVAPGVAPKSGGGGSASANMRSYLKQQHRETNNITLRWLEQNYVLRDGICLPRCLIYHRYLEFIEKIRPGSKPIGAAAFGKLVRQKFPKISTRRLGTRGQSKYHYYGIGVRQTSPFFQDQATIMISQNHGGSPPTAILQDLRYHQRNQTQALPPEALTNGMPNTASLSPVPVSNDSYNHHVHTHSHHQYQMMDVYATCQGQNFYVDPTLAGFSSPPQPQPQVASVPQQQQQQQQQPQTFVDAPDQSPQQLIQDIGQQLHHHGFVGFHQPPYEEDGSVVHLQVPLAPEVNIYPRHHSLPPPPPPPVPPPPPPPPAPAEDSFSMRKVRHLRHDNKRRNRMLMQTIPVTAMAATVTTTKAIGRTNPAGYPVDEPISDLQRRIIKQVEQDFESFCSVTPNTTFGYFQQNYPAPEDLPKPPPEVSRHILATFLVMYHSHCQRIFDTFQLANVDELRRSLSNFWQEMPAHLAPLMASPFVLRVIQLVDILLYRTIEDFFSQLSLMPEMSETFVSDMKMILINVNEWLGGAILGQSSRMREIITNYQLECRTDPNGCCEPLDVSKCPDSIYNQVEQHLMKLLRLKSETFDDFSMAIQKQLKFIDIVKDCRKRIQQSRQMYQMQMEIQTLASYFVDPVVETTSGGDHPESNGASATNEMLTTNVSVLVNGEKSSSPTAMEPATRTGSGEADGELIITNATITPVGTGFGCQCPTPEIILQQVYEQFQLLIKYMQCVGIYLVKILSWTKACVDRNAMKCNAKCLKRRSKILLYGINFYVSNVMRDLTVNDCKSLAIWNMVFLCIKEYVLLHLTRVDRYEAKLAGIRNVQIPKHQLDQQQKQPPSQPPQPQQPMVEFWYYTQPPPPLSQSPYEMAESTKSTTSGRQTEVAPPSAGPDVTGEGNNTFVSTTVSPGGGAGSSSGDESASTVYTCLS